eukprot:GHUV01005908.1.p1 GENE.GHUV01005908.1~~GHUV01005908.1.p1  ORF type:complete len:258 (+),score=62.80 GHUV01005908.1:94-774(+)
MYTQTAFGTTRVAFCLVTHLHTMEHKGRRAAGKRAPLDRPTTISKEMSKILRHQPPPGMDAQGFVAVDELRAMMRSKPTEDEIRAVVTACSKQRFVLQESEGTLRVRAAQGHSVQLDAPVLTPITDAAAVACAVHATSNEGWEAIQDSGQLLRMSRTHIHFATSPELLRTNKWANVLLKVKLQDALAAGHEFFLSSNDVLLCEGPLPIEFVEVISREQLQQKWTAG